jgi:hypothetical protein
MFVGYGQVKEDLNKYAVEVANLKDQLENVKIRENVKFYDVLRRIIDAENNSWNEEKSHNKRLGIIGDAMQEISNKYEEYLP